MNYYVKKILSAVITLFIISAVLFTLVRIVPGNPFDDSKMNEVQIEQKRQELGLNDPIPVQYVHYMSNLLKGDLGSGSALYAGVPIKAVLGESLRNSFMIGGFSVIIGVAIGILLGIVAAIYRGKFPDYLCTAVSLIGVCVPSYVFLIYLQRLFVFKIHIFPTFFSIDNFLASAFLPAVSLALFSISVIAKFTRNEMREVMNSDYIHLVEAKGIHGRELIFNHILRNALVPIITVIAPLVVDLLTGAAVTEKVYGINGIGRLMVDAISGEGVDYNYVLILGLLYSTIYIITMLLMDILYGLIDPRMKTKEGAA